MRKKAQIFLFATCTLALASCGGNADDVDSSRSPVVTVNAKTLYADDIADVVPHGLSAADSQAVATAYIEAWVDDELIYAQASRNIVDQAKIDHMIEDYRRSLIVNSYQERLLREKLANDVSDDELKEFYEANKNRFVLEDDLIKGLYLKVPAKSAQLPNFQKWYKQGTDDAVKNIDENKLQGAVSYDYFYNKWMSFETVMENIPLSINNPAQYLKTNRNMEVRDSAFVYMLNIKQYILAGSVAPYEYAKERVSELYKEKKRADYLQQVRKDLHNKASSDKKIKFYNK